MVLRGGSPAGLHGLGHPCLCLEAGGLQELIEGTFGLQVWALCGAGPAGSGAPRFQARAGHWLRGLRGGEPDQDGRGASPRAAPPSVCLKVVPPHLRLWALTLIWRPC